MPRPRNTPTSKTLQAAAHVGRRRVHHLLRYHLKRQRMSQLDLDRAMGWEPNNVGRILAKDTNITINTLAMMAHCLGCELDIRFTATKDRTKAQTDPKAA